MPLHCISIQYEQSNALPSTKLTCYLDTWIHGYLEKYKNELVTWIFGYLVIGGGCKHSEVDNS